jgi:RNA polymerase sigma factor FliA
MVKGVDAYEQQIDDSQLEAFVLEYRPLVKKIALYLKRRLPSHIELEDLLQSGFVGLLEAKQHYNVQMGANFDSLRKNSWGTRDLLKNLRQMSEAINRLEQRSQKAPTTEEVAAEMGITIEEHAKLCQYISVAHVMSLDMMNDDNVLFDETEQDNPSEIAQRNDLLKHIQAILPTLPEREQQVLSLYYIEELTFKHIGEILDLTEARICQLHSQAIARIQAKIRREEMA